MKKISVAVFLIVTACSTSKQITQTTASSQQNSVVAGKLFATLFMQRAAEYRALCLQAFNIAHLRVDESLQNLSAKPKAIITDIDETILDNSPYEAHQTLQGKDYESPSWYQWTEMSAADTVPGAAAFLKYAATKGITIFYVTNREEREKKSTLINLQKFNLPNADIDHLLAKQTTIKQRSKAPAGCCNA